MADKKNESASTALVPVDEREVVLYEDTLTAVLVNVDGKEEGQIYVPVKPISDALGLSWSGQSDRLRRDEVLAEEIRLIRITRINPQGGRPDLLCLPLEFIPGWLFGIQANRVKPELKSKILLFRRECYKVLSEAFQEGRLTTSPTFTELLESDSPAAQAYKMAKAMMSLARNQLLLESRLDQHDTKLLEYVQRIEDIEATLGDPGRHITPSQAMQISQAVKAIAMELSKQSRRNEYGGVYGEFYRKFGITSYKLLPAQRFEEAMDFLNQWHQDLVGDAPF
jgi:hypothetical protein